jgi:hypothetical protein
MLSLPFLPTVTRSLFGSNICSTLYRLVRIFRGTEMHRVMRLFHVTDLIQRLIEMRIERLANNTRVVTRSTVQQSLRNEHVDFRFRVTRSSGSASPASAFPDDACEGPLRRPTGTALPIP